MDALIIFAAQYLLLVSVAGMAYLLYRLEGARRKELVTLLVVGGILSLVISRFGHHFYQDPRPFIADPHIRPLFDGSRDNGFPSDHTLLTAFLGFAALCYSRRAGIALLAIAALVGWGRVAGHVHHLKDVIGSFVITALASWLALWLIRLKAKKKALPRGERPAA